MADKAAKYTTSYLLSAEVQIAVKQNVILLIKLKKTNVPCHRWCFIKNKNNIYILGTVIIIVIQNYIYKKLLRLWYGKWSVLIT